ncbi:MAG: carbohydrate kinase [Candidatus Bipolaricaulia bacterium]
MTDIFTLGEALIDFVPTESGLPLSEVPGFRRRFGGAPANVAMGLAKLGSDAGFIGKVGEDSFGDFLTQELFEAGVNIDQLYKTDRANTTLAFVSLTKEGDRDFAFYRNPGADELLQPEEIDAATLGEAKVFHFGSISFTQPESLRATKKAVAISQDENLKVTMDPNIRLNLWEEPSKLKSLVESLLGKVDLIKLSEEEVYFLTDTEDLKTGITNLSARGPKTVVVTLGARGCLLYRNGRIKRLDGYQVEVKDTTGAGDGFMAGLLHNLLKNTDKLSNLQTTNLLEAAKFGNATGALTTTDYGATSAFPDPTDVDKFLEER